MDDELVSAVATEMRRHLKAEVMDDRAAEVWAFVAGIDDAARAIIPLVATALRQELPDEIDLFRIIRKAGRSDADKAKAVAAAIRAGGVA